MSRKNISISNPVEDRAKDLIQSRGFSGLSDLISTLIREEYERRHPPTLQESQANYGSKPPPPKQSPPRDTKK